MIPGVLARNIMQINGGTTGPAFGKASECVHHHGLYQV